MVIVVAPDRDAFRDALNQHPGALCDEVITELASMGEVEGHGPTLVRWAEVLELARTDPDAAWRRLEQDRKAADAVGKTLEPLGEEIEAYLRARQFDQALAGIDRALPRAREAGLGAGVGLLYRQRAQALLETTAGSHADNVEAAIEALESALPLCLDDEDYAGQLMNLGLAVGMRVHGDPAENLERAIELLEEALGILGEAGSAERRAFIKSNLATALLRRERGGRIENLRRAASHGRDALTYRSPERDGVDWAHTQLNLAAILEALREEGEVEEVEPRIAYEAVIAAEDKIAEPWLVGVAHYSLAGLLRKSTERSSEELVNLHELHGQIPDESEIEQERLGEALDHLKEARGRTADAPDPARHGLVLDELALVLSRLDREDEALPLAEQATEILTPTRAPKAAAEASTRLGSLYANRGQWREAADAYRTAVTAADLSYYGRLETASREEEARDAGNLARWAAYALAKAGFNLEAAQVLDGGRTRELRRRSGAAKVAEGELDDIPAELRQRLQHAAQELVSSPLGQRGAPSARQLEEALTGIRQLPGRASFLTAATDEDLANAVESGWPLVFVNPTDSGTLLLSLTTAEGGLVADSIFLQEPTSLELYLHLWAAGAADTDAALEAVEPASYLMGIGGVGTAELRRGIEEGLPWIGERIGKEIASLARRLGARGLTLVPCGPISVAPLHAASWEQDGGSSCLLDLLPIRYAPSALVGGVALERAREREQRRPSLVALTDPRQNLPAAEAESALIADLFANATEASAAEATFQFLRANVPGATHIHLACHARGGLFDSAETGIEFSDGIASAEQLGELANLETRLVVVSACQSAVANIADLPEEATSISTVLLGVGSACAVASLWPVDDASTALLMVRFWEEMIQHDSRPPEALRVAQLWLRDLRPDEEGIFLQDHPLLAEVIERRRREGHLPGRRSTGDTSKPGVGPYAHPEYWAPFIAVGA